MSLKTRIKALVTGKPAESTPTAPAIDAKLAAARDALTAAQLVFDNAALELEEVPADPAQAQRRAQAMAQAQASRDEAQAAVGRLESALQAQAARAASDAGKAARKARAALVAQRTAALTRLHAAAAEAVAAEDAYVASRVKVQRVVDESLPLFPDGTRSAIHESNLYVIPALFQKMHDARLPYSGIKILLSPGAPTWLPRLPDLTHAESK